MFETCICSAIPPWWKQVKIVIVFFINPLVSVGGFSFGVDIYLKTFVIVIFGIAVVFVAAFATAFTETFKE